MRIALTPLQAASCTYHIALGPRAGQKVRSLQTISRQREQPVPALCANAHGFSLRAAVRCAADQRRQLERLCRYITHPAIANERLKRNRAGQVVLQVRSACTEAHSTSCCRNWRSCRDSLRVMPGRSREVQLYECLLSISVLQRVMNVAVGSNCVILRSLSSARPVIQRLRFLRQADARTSHSCSL
jgi:putative transposase